MTVNEIKDYLADNTEFPEIDLDLLAEHIYTKLSYAPIYDQIDHHVDVITQCDDWQDAIRRCLYDD